MSKITLDREVITPAQAKRYLEGNLLNRNIRKGRVEAIAGAIIRDEWRENAETIKFNGDGQLVDGQHRLLGIVKAGRSVPCWIARGVPVEAQETMDIGSARNVSDMLTLRGHTYASVKAAIARRIYFYEQTGEPSPSSQQQHPTPQQVITIVEREGDDLTHLAEWASRYPRQDPALRLTSGMVGALRWRFARAASDEDALRFFDEILAPVGTTTPPGLLRSRLIKAPTNQQLPILFRLALTTKAWNSWIRGERLRNLRWRGGGAAAEPFPAVAGPPIPDDDDQHDEEDR